MKPFTLLAARHPAAPGFSALDLTHCDWKAQTWRQEYPASAHTDTETIYYRMPEVINEHTVFDDAPAVDLPTYLPGVKAIVSYVHSLVKDFDAQCGEVSRVMLVKLNAWGSVSIHKDEGSYAEAHYRTHTVVSNAAGARLYCANEAIDPKIGEVWLLDHHQYHAALNCAHQDRIHLIVDVRRSKHALAN